MGKRRRSTSRLVLIQYYYLYIYRCIKTPILQLLFQFGDVLEFLLIQPHFEFADEISTVSNHSGASNNLSNETLEMPPLPTMDSDDGDHY